MRSICISVIAIFSWAHVFACTTEFVPVCGYWMHSPKTQTFQNQCKMNEAGAKLRHAGSCQDTPNKQTPNPASKSNGK
jgi:hypothetical protein